MNEEPRDCNFCTWSEYCTLRLDGHAEKVVIVNEALMPTAIILHDYSQRMERLYTLLDDYGRRRATFAALEDCLREAQQHKYDNAVLAVFKQYLTTITASLPPTP